MLVVPACGSNSQTTTSETSRADRTSEGENPSPQGAPGQAASFDEQRRQAAQDLLDRFAQAQLAGDTEQISSMIHPGAPQQFRDFHLERARNLASSDPDEWAYTVTDGPEAFVATELVEALGVRDAWAPAIRLRYSVGGEESRVDRPSDIMLVLDGTEWLIGGAQDNDAARWAQVPWDQGPTVERSSPDGSSVIAHPSDDVLAAQVVDLLPEAVSGVTRRWSQQRDDARIIVEIASSREEFTTLTGGGLAAHDGATPRSGADVVAAAIANPAASASPGEGQRIVIAGEAFSSLGRESRLAALRHEVAHVLTRSRNPMPLWLVEGIAELAAKGDQHPDPRASAARVMDLVERYGPPDSLPRDDHFTGGGNASLLAYELAWTFVAYLAEAHGEAAVIEAYWSADARGGGAQEFSNALQDSAAVSLPEAINEWGRWLAR